MTYTLKRQEVIIDPRSPLTKYIDWSESSSARGAIYILSSTLMLIGFFLPDSISLSLFAFASLIVLPTVFRSRQPDLPGRLPENSGLADPTEGKDDKGRTKPAKGSMLLGNDSKTGKEFWLSWGDSKVHAYIMGATGAGKSEALLTWSMNFIFSGSGILAGDGKGTQMFPKQYYTLTRMVGAEDDFFGINYITGDKTRIGRRKTKGSNSINPFASSSAATSKETMASLMSASNEGGGDNQVFVDQAVTLLEYLMPILHELKVMGLLELDIREIGRHMPLDELYKLTKHPELSRETRAYAKSYLSGLSYNFEKPANQQPDNVTKMHGYALNYFQKIIASFTTNYSSIYLTDQGEVNINDTVDNRRFLVFTIPALEKSGNELTGLGKVLLTLARAASARGLGDEYEGTREETTSNLPKAWKTPYSYQFDEFAFYIIEDFSLLPAQIRGINISGLMGAQDYIGTERGGQIDAESIFSNARLKLIGAMEDSGKTWDKVSGLLGEVDVIVRSGYEHVSGWVGRYMPNSTPSVVRRKPVDIQDLQELDAGRFATIWRGKYSMIDFVYTDINEHAITENIRYHRLVRSYFPTDAEYAATETELNLLDFLCQDRKRVSKLPASLKKIARLAGTASGSGKDIGCEILAGFHKELSLTVTPTRRSNSPLADPQHQPDITSTGHLEAAPSDIDSSEGLAEFGDSSLYADFDEGEETRDETDDDSTEHCLHHTLDSAVAQQVEVPDPEKTLNSEDLLPETSKQAECLTQHSEGNEYVSLDAETQDRLLREFASINEILGMSSEDAVQTAKGSVSSLAAGVSYMIPPKPVRNAESLAENVRKIMEGGKPH
ncbi:type IV secretory system conjugative DNA transfer family protein [Marinobacterium jannaschii]|uniref:type IV secretory system conjugative DNA transfer family protein n=1 Tax=Marinobacterium jannaschii TaxID=64970 RepID=UPI000485E7C8|nr:TraM recognition domain-containing protein [Marinobacterium jannaschii]